MCNETLFQKLSEEFSEEEMLLFCKMQSNSYNLQYIDRKEWSPFPEQEDLELHELSYEGNWWEKKYLQMVDNQLKTQEKEYE